MAKKAYRTASGKLVDMDTLALKNETVIAVGNMNVNARGDQLGEGGSIVKTREEIMTEHYATKGAVVPKQANRELAPSIQADAPAPTPAVVVEKDVTDDETGTMDDPEVPTDDADEEDEEPDSASSGEWVEDPATGDFVKSGNVTTEKPTTRGIAAASAADQTISVAFVESEKVKLRKKKGVKRL